MSSLRRSPWLALCLAVVGCLVCGVAAQTFAPSGVQFRGSVTPAVKVEDIVNVTGAFPTLAGQVQLPLYTVPMNKRLVLTSVHIDEHNWGASLDLVEDNAGTVTRKVMAPFAVAYSTTALDNVALSFPYPLGLLFEPGSTVAIRRYNDTTLPSGNEVRVLLVGALVDAY